MTPCNNTLAYLALHGQNFGRALLQKLQPGKQKRDEKGAIKTVSKLSNTFTVYQRQSLRLSQKLTEAVAAPTSKCLGKNVAV